MSKAITPWYLDKALYVTALSIILPYLAPKLGVNLDPVKVAAALVVAASYVVSHKWKSGKVLLAEIAADAAAAARKSLADNFGAPETTKSAVPDVAKALAVLLALGLAFHAAPASAQVLVSSGPTLPLLEVRPDNPHPISLAAGAGVQLSFTLPELQRAIAGRAWDFLDVNLMAFGTAVSSSSGATFGAFSAAVGLCTLSSLICVGGGHDVATSPGLKPGWFGLFALAVNIDSAPSAPKLARFPASWLARGNTLYLGSP